MFKALLIGLQIAVGRSLAGDLRSLSETELTGLSARLGVDLRRSDKLQEQQLRSMLEMDQPADVVEGSIGYWQAQSSASIGLFQDNELVAAAIFRSHRSWLKREAEPFLYQIVVSPRHRAKGLGRKMLMAAMSGFASLGYKRMLLMVENTSPAARLYMALGFIRLCEVIWRPGSSFLVAELGTDHVPGSNPDLRQT